MKYVLVLAALFAGSLCAQYTASTVALNYAGLDISATGTDRTSQLVEFTTGSGYLPQDEGKLDNVPIGFTFAYFGQSYTTVDVSANGFLCFDDINIATGALSPYFYADPAPPNNFIACGYNDYGYLAATPGTARFYTQTLGASPNREFRVQCKAFEAVVGRDPVAWICRLFETSNRIEIHCDIGSGGTLSNGKIVAGLEGPGGTMGIPCTDGWTQGQKPTNGWAFVPQTGAEIDVQRPAGRAVQSNAQDDLGNPTEALPINVTYRIANYGTTNLNITGAVTASSLGNCTCQVTSQPASTNLAPGAVTTMQVQITPTSAATGFFLARFQIPSNDANENPFNLLVSGTAGTSTTPDVDCPPAPGTVMAYDALAGGRLMHDFGRLPLGVPRQLTYTIYNTSAGTLNITSSPRVTVGGGGCTMNVITQPPASIAGFGSATFVISITATGADIFASVAFTSNDPDFESNWSIIVLGRGITASTADMDMQRPAGTSIANGANDALGATGAGVPANFTYTIANTGSAALNLTGSPRVALSGITNCTASVSTQPAAFIAPAGSTTFTVTATPNAGAFSFKITVYSDDPDEYPYVVNASGTGAASPEIDIQRPAGTGIADGGSTTVTGATTGTPVNLTFTILNTGSGTLNLTGASPVSATNLVNVSGLSITQPSLLTLATSQSTTFGVTFTPGAGAFSLDLDVLSNDADESNYDIAVSGTASVPDIDITRGAAIASGGTDTITGASMGALQNLTYTISNAGGATLTLTGPNPVSSLTPVNISGSVALTQPASLSLAVSTSTTFDVAFTPLAAGTFSFTIHVASNDPNENPYVILVTGNAAATAPEIDLRRSGLGVVSGGTDSLGSGFTTGTPALVNYTLHNLGTATLNLTGTSPNYVAITGATGCTAVVTLQPLNSIGAGSQLPFTVTVTPTGGAYSFSVSIANNDGDENPYTFTANGSTTTGGSSGTGSGGGGGGGCSGGDQSGLAVSLLVMCLVLWIRAMTTRCLARRSGISS